MTGTVYQRTWRRTPRHGIAFEQPIPITREGVKPPPGLIVVGLQVLLVGLTYYFAGRLGLAFRFQNSQIAVIWPANAVLVSAMLLTPRRRWWLLIAATAIAHAAVMYQAVPAWRWLWQISGNTAFCIATAVALREFAGMPLDLGSRRQALVFTGISFVLPALFGFAMPAFVRSLLGLEPANPPTALLRTTLSNGTGMLLVVPVILQWTQYGGRRLNEIPKRRFLELACITTSLIAVALVAFGSGPRLAIFPSLLLLIFPPLLWAAVRFGPLGASTALFGVAAFSLLGAARQLGPFVRLTHIEQVFALQLFWIMLAIPVILLAAVIREREQAEDALHEQRDELAHVTRVATVGTMSGALAHELRQPLASILANAQAAIHLLSHEPVDRVLLRQILDDITQEDRQASGVISRLRSFMKEGRSRFETVAVDAMVRDALALGRVTISMASVEVQTQIAPGLVRVKGDPVQLLQVVLNLIVNACESMTANASNRRLSVQVGSAGTRRDHVEILVADSGTGLPAGAEDRVFEPFFTTKEKGLGLGLAISRSIVNEHGGQLWGENNQLGGATFHLVLPSEHTRAKFTSIDRHR